MGEPTEPPFDFSRFADDGTDDIGDVRELINHIDALIESGEDITPALTFIADQLANCDEREERLYSAILLDLLERGGGSPDMVLHHARNFAERCEEEGLYLKASTACSIVASVLLEKGRLKDTGRWVDRMRVNLQRHATEESEANDLERAHHPGVIKKILDFEGAYFISLADSGQGRQARREIDALLDDPVIPAEEHTLASARGFIETDAGNPVAALRYIHRAEKRAAELGDFCEATIYACRLLTPTVTLIGRGNIPAIIEAAKGHLEKAIESDADPEDIQHAIEVLQGYIDKTSSF